MGTPCSTRDVGTLDLLGRNNRSECFSFFEFDLYSLFQTDGDICVFQFTPDALPELLEFAWAEVELEASVV
jgi:hypothetical protein